MMKAQHKIRRSQADYKRIGINASMLDDCPTGVGIYSINMINHLARLYDQSVVDITVFSPTRISLDGKLKIILLPKYLKSSEYGKKAALFRFIWNTLYYPLKARKFDVLLSPTTHGSFGLSGQIITIHDLLSLQYNNISRHQRFYFRYLLPILIKRANRVITVSESTKNDIIKYLKCPRSKISVIYNGYDSDRYNTAVQITEQILQKYGVSNYFLAIGPTYPHKNFKLLIEAYSELSIQIRHRFPLVIVGGKRDYLKTLRVLVEKNCLESQVHFLGYVPIEFMAALYKEAYLLVFPSLYEGFGFPLLEAMACGCPVIASDTSSIPEVCERAALYFNPYDKVALKNHLNSLITNEDLYSYQVELGLEQVKKFSWSEAASNLKKILEENCNHN